MQCCCNQAWTKSGGRIPRNVTAMCETFKISCLMGETPYEGRFGAPFKVPVVPFGVMVECHFVSANQSRLHQFGEFHLEYS